MRRTLIAIFAALALLVAAPAAALATTQTASSGIVTATYSFQGKYPNYSHETLRISRSGQVFYNEPVSSSYCGHACEPGSSLGGHGSSVHVIDLESDGQPDVVLDLYTGGAHCCSVEQIFWFDPGTMTYQRSTYNFGDPGESIKDLGHNGHLEFRTADDSFAYEFTDFADSGLPIRILTFSAGKFTNVTRKYPALIAKDAAVWLKAFKHDLANGVGLIAAWAADEDLLGHSAQVKSYLAKQLKEGHLRSALSPQEPGGQKFVTALNKFLRKHGYLG